MRSTNGGQSHCTTERIDKAGLWLSSLFSRGFSAIRAIRSLALFPLSSDLPFDILH
jgi:hypothetical protein